MNETLAVVCEIGVGLITIPWCIWVTTSIFSTKQSLALHKQEFALYREETETLRRMERVIEQMKGKKT